MQIGQSTNREPSKLSIFDLRSVSRTLRIFWTGTRILFLMSFGLWTLSMTPLVSPGIREFIQQNQLTVAVLYILFLVVIPYFASGRMRILLIVGSILPLILIAVGGVWILFSLTKTPALIQALQYPNCIFAPLRGSDCISRMDLWYELLFALGFLGILFSLIAGIILIFRYISDHPQGVRKIFTGFRGGVVHRIRQLVLYRPSIFAILLLLFASASAYAAISIAIETRLYGSEAMGNFCVKMGYGSIFQHMSSPKPFYNCFTPWMEFLYVSIVLFIFLMFLLATRMFVNGAVRLMKPTADRVLLNTKIKPILFLRSFEADQLRVRPTGLFQLLQIWRPRLEQKLAYHLAKIAPLIAVGQPGETIPALGAYRAYFSDDRWRDRVFAWIKLAKNVVVLAGPTPGIKWELEKIAETETLKNSLIILPRQNSSVRNETASALEVALPVVRKRPPECGWSQVLAVMFDDEEHPVYVQAHGRNEVDYELLIRLFQSRQTADIPAGSSGYLSLGLDEEHAELRRGLTNSIELTKKRNSKIRRRLLLVALICVATFSASLYWMSLSQTRTAYIARNVFLGLNTFVRTGLDYGMPSFLAENILDVGERGLFKIVDLAPTKLDRINGKKLLLEETSKIFDGEPRARRETKLRLLRFEWAELSPKDLKLQRWALIQSIGLADEKFKLKKNKEALIYYRRAITFADNALKNAPKVNHDMIIQRSYALRGIATVHSKNREFGKAEKVFARAFQGLENLPEKVAKSQMTADTVAPLHLDYSRMLLASGHIVKANQSLRVAFEYSRKAARNFSDSYLPISHLYEIAILVFKQAGLTDLKLQAGLTSLSASLTLYLFDTRDRVRENNAFNALQKLNVLFLDAHKKKDWNSCFRIEDLKAVFADYLRKKKIRIRGNVLKGDFITASWYAILSKNFSAALNLSERAIAANKTDLIAHTNYASALMLTGKTDLARSEYLRYRGRQIPKLGSWEKAILSDFEVFRKEGINHPLMEEIGTLFEKRPLN